MKFNLNQQVKVVKDENGSWFVDCEGIIEAIDKNNLIGLRIYKPNALFSDAGIDICNTILYFKEEELELIQGE